MAEPSSSLPTIFEKGEGGDRRTHPSFRIGEKQTKKRRKANGILFLFVCQPARSTRTWIWDQVRSGSSPPQVDPFRGGNYSGRVSPILVGSNPLQKPSMRLDLKPPTKAFINNSKGSYSNEYSSYSFVTTMSSWLQCKEGSRSQHIYHSHPLEKKKG